MFGIGRYVRKTFSSFLHQKRASDNLLEIYKKTNEISSNGVSISHNVDLYSAKLDDFCNVAHHAQISRSSIGKRTSVGRYTKIQKAVIGSYCSISWDVSINALRHPVNAVSMHAFSFRKQFGLCEEDYNIEHLPVHIGHDVWIGCHAIIMPGVRIGDGAVIGAGSIVTHDVAPYEIVAGCPARHLRWRFSQNIRDIMLKLKWWELDDDSLRKNIDLFSPEVDIECQPEVLERLKGLVETYRQGCKNNE